MMLTNEQLLAPRFKMIADYPNSPFAVGRVVKMQVDDLEAISHYSKYPAIFQRLQWWEERAKEEMPEYIKLKEDLGDWVLMPDYYPDAPWLFDVDVNQYGCWDFLPATLSEYESFKAEKK